MHRGTSLVEEKPLQDFLEEVRYATRNYDWCLELDWLELAGTVQDPSIIPEEMIVLTTLLRKQVVDRLYFPESVVITVSDFARSHPEIVYPYETALENLLAVSRALLLFADDLMF